MADLEDGFLTRWSRRKRDARHGPDSPEAGADQPAPDAGDAVPEVASEQEKILERLPDIDSLDEHSDFSVFLQQGVPEELRNRALRKLWRVNPLFAHIDGLDDYDEDYTVAASVIKGLKTLDQVGKGMPAPQQVEEDELAEARESVGAENEPPPGETDEPVTPAAELDPAADLPETPIAEHEPGTREPAPIPRPQDPVKSRGPSHASAKERRWGRFKS